MQVSITDNNIKILLEEILIKMIQEKRDVFYELILEAIEDVSMANAIQKGRNNRFVDESQVVAILEGQS